MYVLHLYQISKLRGLINVSGKTIPLNALLGKFSTCGIHQIVTNIKGQIAKEMGFLQY